MQHSAILLLQTIDACMSCDVVDNPDQNVVVVKWYEYNSYEYGIQEGSGVKENKLAINGTYMQQVLTSPSSSLITIFLRGWCLLLSMGC